MCFFVVFEKHKGKAVYKYILNTEEEYLTHLREIK